MLTPGGPVLADRCAVHASETKRMAEMCLVTWARIMRLGDSVGGWVDTTTLQKCYQVADEETMEAVVLQPKQLKRVG